MARIMAEWHPKHGPVTNIMLLDGVKGNTDPLALVLCYDFHEFGCHLGNVGENQLPLTIEHDFDYITDRKI